MKLPPKRYLSPLIGKDLPKKMVFLGGPRQVGKTHLALSLLRKPKKDHPAYFNWDISKQRKSILNSEFPRSEKLIILDEIHKYARWRNLVKGFYDGLGDRHSFLVTGSARLDYYRKGGDSLQGRYHYYRLHPFCAVELNSKPTKGEIEHLMKFGGFPEPCVAGDSRTWRRWQHDRIQRVIYEDLRDLERVKEITLIETLIGALPDRVGSPLSLKSIGEDLQVASSTVDRWITIFENLYLCFRIAPFGAPKIRAVKKEQKLYFWDWTQTLDVGYRFENLVASQLLKFCHFVEDTTGYRMELRFIRDTDRREVDFVVLKDRSPIFAVECKTGEKQIAPATKYFRERTNIPRFYQVHLGSRDFGDEDKGTRVLPFWKFCQEIISYR